MTALVAEIGFGRSGASAAFVRAGWGPVEPHHRWTVGQESQVVLPVGTPGSDQVVVINARPWHDAACLPVQAVMLAVNGRLLATIRWDGHRTLAFDLPPDLPSDQPVVLSIHHLNCAMPRPATGLDHAGRPLGLLVTSIRLFRLPPRPVSATIYPALGNPARDVRALTGLSAEALMTRFESIGQNCEFGLVQRHFGADPLGLLRFSGSVTHMLVDGLMQGFAGVGAPETMRAYLSDPPEAEFKVHDERYYLWYSTGQTAGQTTQAAVLHQQCRRLDFLQRKFVEDLRESDKIYVLTRAENLSEPEALAAMCALQVEAPNTLLWTTHGDRSRTGQVDCLRPGFLQGHLGAVDDRIYATPEAWLSVLAAAHQASEHATA